MFLDSMYSSPLTRFKQLYGVYTDSVPSRSAPNRRPSGRLNPLKTPEINPSPDILEKQARAQNAAGKSFSEVLPKIINYLSKTRLEEDFHELLFQLLSQSVLPYNPYPWFVQKMTLRSERLLLAVKYPEPSSVPFTDVVKLQNCSFIWGLPAIVSMVNGAEIWRYLWLLKDITPNLEKHQLPEDYTCQVIPAIVGPTVFYGSVYRFPYSVEFKFEFIVVGHDVERGVKLFLREILNDVRDLEACPLHILLRIYVPVKENEIWVNKMWIYSDVINRENEMMALLEEAVYNHQPIISECLFSIDHNGGFYIHGQKHYVLTIVKISSQIKEEDEIIHFTDAPFATLYEGIFTKQSYVESYLTVYRNDFTDEEHSKEERKEDISATAASNNDQDVYLNHGTDPVEAFQGQPDLEPPPLRPRKSSRTHERNSKWDGTNVNIDEFRNELDDCDVSSAEIKGLIRQNYRKRLMQLNLETEPWLVLHNVLLLELLDGGDLSELLPELSRAAHSQAAQLYALMHLNRSLRELIYKFEAVNLRDVPMPILVSMLKEYKRTVLKFFDDQRATENSLFFACHSTILQRLSSLEKWTDGTRAITMEALKLIKDLNSYMHSFYLMYVKTMLDMSPLLSNLMKSMKSQTSAEFELPDATNENHELQADSGQVEIPTAGGLRFKHGLENDRIMKNDARVVDVELCVCNSHSNSLIEAKQIVLMKYAVDTRLDQLWSEFLAELFSREKFPENPCNRLISLMRQSSMKVDLCYETSQATFSAIKSSHSIVESEFHRYIYQIPQFSIYGLRLQTVLGIVDPVSLQRTLHNISPLFQKNFRFQDGSYKVAICTAICGNATLFGRLDPYLPVIQLNEFCFIQGPKGCAIEAMQLYIRITFEDILSKYKANEYILDGVSFNGKLWSIDEIIYKKKGFAMQMEQSMKAFESICFKLFILEEWLFIPVIKHLLFNYIAETEPEIDCFYPENRYSLYQNFFLEADRAAFHLHFAGPSDGGDPFHGFNVKMAADDLERDISLRVQQSDWLEVCRLLFWHSQLTTDLVRNVMLAEEHEYLLEIGERKLKEMMRQPRLIDSKQQDAVMIQMLKAFKQKAIEVCSEERCLAPHGIVTAVAAKVDSLIEKDEETGEYLVGIDLKSIIVLDEIVQMLSMLRDLLSYDFLLSSAGFLDILQSINTGFVSNSVSLNKL